MIAKCKIRLVPSPLFRMFITVCTNQCVQQCKYEICVPRTYLSKCMENVSSYEEANEIRYNMMSIFGEIEESEYYLHHYHRWNQHSKVHDFETHLYTDDVKTSIDMLYR